MIFDEYLAGKGVTYIAKQLRAKGVQITKGGVLLILRNPKYQGDLVLQQSFVENHISKRKRKNMGQLPQYHVKDSHEPIISRETFAAVQAEIARRVTIQPSNKKLEDNPLVGKIKCGLCGGSYIKKHTAINRKYDKIVWMCLKFNYYGKEECPSKRVSEDILLAHIAELGGLDCIQQITVFPDTLVFAMNSGDTVKREWHNPSRSQSWTPEMKEKARQTALARSAAKEAVKNGK
jgi:hypothetical protein